MQATHLKLFIDGDERHAALFKGDNEASDWLYNCVADEVLQEGWHLLPKEELISLEEIQAKGFLQNAFLSNTLHAESTDPLRNWQLRSADLRIRLASEAAVKHDYAVEAQHANAAADLLAQFCDDPRQVLLLLQAVEAYLRLWKSSEDPAVACSIAGLFDRLKGCRWPEDDPDGPENSARNQLFWLGKAAQCYAKQSVHAEAQGDLNAAAVASEAVVSVQQQLAALTTATRA